MGAGDLADAVLALALFGLSAAAVLARRAFTAVAVFIAYGLLLTLAWVRLAAVDVALTEAAIGAGLSGLLLLGAARRLRRAGPARRDDLPGPGMRLLIALCCAAVSLAVGAAVLALPDPAPSLAPQAVANLPATELGNPVTAVLMSFRALDTLLEAAVLVLCVVALWALTPDRAWGGMAGIPQPRLERGALCLLARLLPPVGIVVAVHILWVGADAPGGKFQAAAILAAMWLLPWQAGLVRPAAISSRLLRSAIVIGPALFILAGFAGWLLEGAFLAYPRNFTKAAIMAVEIGLTGSIAVALAMLVLGPPAPGGRR